MKKLIPILLLVLVSFSFVLAIQPQQSYNKKFLDPLYTESLNKNQIMTYNLTVDTPDGISSVENAMVTFQVWQNPSVRYYLWVNGQTCNTPSFYVSTTYANAGEGTIFFDCSNVITKEGKYTVELKPSKNTGTITGWIDLTYTNNPKANIKVHGTEYKPGDAAKSWLQLIDASGDYVNNALCFVDIYDHNNNQVLEFSPMINSNHDGVYYKNLQAPQAQGVYPVIARCYYNGYDAAYNMTSVTIDEGSITANDFTDTYVSDGTRFKIKEDSSKSIDVTHTFTGITIPPANVTLAIGLYWEGRWSDTPTNDNLIFSIYNYTSNSWITFPNEVYAITGNQVVTNAFSETGKNLEDLGYISSSGEVKIRVIDTGISDTQRTVFQTDEMHVLIGTAGAAEWQNVKGASELHISSDKLWTTKVESGQVFNNTWPGNFDYNVTLSSQTSQFEDNQHIYVELPTPFPCHHVQALYVDGVEMNFTGKDPINPETAGCSVEWDQSLNKGANYNVRIVSENYFKEIESTWETESAFDYDMVKIACKNYQVTNGYADFTIPQTEEPENVYDDKFMAVCSDYLNTYYHFNKSYNEDFEINKGTLTAVEMDSLDEQWRHMTYLINRLQTESINILGGLTTGASYSTALITNPTGQPLPAWATYWANFSTSYLNFKQLYGLTTGAIPISINQTSIAQAVWDYTGSINSNLLSQIATSVWSYASRVLTAFNFNVVDEQNISNVVWNNTNRSLTQAVQVAVNTTEISDKVWNYPARYTHGVEL